MNFINKFVSVSNILLYSNVYLGRNMKQQVLIICPTTCVICLFLVFYSSSQLLQQRSFFLVQIYNVSYKQALILFQESQFHVCAEQCASDDRCLYLTVSQTNCTIFTIGANTYDFSTINLFTVRYRTRQVRLDDLSNRLIYLLCT